jgi:hypothetical protein
MRSRLALRSLSIALALACAVSVSQADVTGPGFTIEAIDEVTGHAGTFSANASWDSDNGTWYWGSTDPISIMATTGEELAILNPSELPTGSASTYFEDPIVNLNFAVQAGVNPTTFRIASALLSFPTLTNPDAVASAGFSVTDTNGNGVGLTGIGLTGGGYLAQYNGFAGAFPTPLGTTFAELQQNLAAGPFGTNSQSEDHPLVGTQVIPATVNDISTLVSFSLSARDLASGTTTFSVVPEPASLALLVLGALVARRR